MDDETKNASPRKLLGVENSPISLSAADEDNPSPDPIRTETALQLVRAYNRIPNRAIANNIYNLIIKLSHSCPYSNGKADNESKF